MRTFSSPTGDPFQIGFLLIDGFSLLTYSAAAEPLRAANQLAGEKRYEIWNIPAQGARSTASCGAIIPANAHVGERLRFDLVMVVSSTDSPDAQQPRLLDWLRQLSRRKIPLGGLGTGPLMLARAGLLRQRRMTLHWAYQHALLEMQPDIKLDQQLYVVDKDRITCAGGTAPFDLMHALIADQHGHEFARAVSDWWSHANVRASEDSQRSGRAQRYRTNNATVLRAIGLMDTHLSDPLDLVQLAESVGVTARQLNRLFNFHMRCSTMTFYRRLRLHKSLQLLTQTSLPISEVVAATGFVSTSHFSQAFKSRYTKTPAQARACDGDEMLAAFSSGHRDGVDVDD